LRGRSAAAAVTAVAVAVSGWAQSSELSTSSPAPTYRWHLPPGFPEPRVPANNPMSEAKVALGKTLFFDARLSVTGRHSCSSCHRPDLAFTDGRMRALGATGAMLPRSAMSLSYAAYGVRFGWLKPGFVSLEAQMRQPLFNRHPIEMGLGGHRRDLLRNLAADSSVAASFAGAFPAAGPPVTVTHLIQAIACYERSLIAGRSSFDRYVFGGDLAALPEGAKRGMALFYSAQTGCSVCHFGITFAGPVALARHRLPVAAFADTGTGGAFKVPTLRNVGRTAPYMHDGRFADLEAVLEHYEHPRRGASAGEKIDARLRPLRLDSARKHDLIDFLNSLSDLESN
jgi:cytochrome c peroxidase